MTGLCKLCKLHFQYRQNGKIMPTVGVCADEVSEHIPKLKSSFWCIMGTCTVVVLSTKKLEPSSVLDGSKGFAHWA